MASGLLLFFALLLDAILGEPDFLWRRFPHPAVLMGRLIGALDRWLNRGTLLRAKGIITVFILLTLGGFTGWCLGLAGPLVEILLAAILLAQRSLVAHVSAVADALRQSLPAGRRTVAMIVSRDVTEMDQSAVSRSAIESAAENLSDGVIAPAFWFLVAGLPGMIIYKIINTADSMIGYRTPRHEAFGWAAARLDDLLNLIPARLTAVLIALGYALFGQWPAIAADARLHKSPNAGWPEAAMARAIDVALAGPRAYDGEVKALAWVNGSSRRVIGPPEIDRALAVLWRTWAMVLALALFSGLVFD